MESEFSIKHINLSDYDTIQNLESDSLGELSLVKSKRTGKIYVFRRLNKTLLNEDVDLENEVAPFFKLNHKTILRFVGSCSDGDSLILATKYIDGKSLQEALENNEIKDPTLKATLIYGIAEGMRYLHENQIIHCDLRPSNILLDSSNNPYITDFGLLKHSKSLQRKPIYKPKEDDYSFSSDVFAFSMIAYQILTGKVPYNNKNARERIDMGERPGLPDAFTSKIDEWLTACWSPNPSERPNFATIVLKFMQNEILMPDVFIPKFQNYVCSVTSSEFATRTLIKALNLNNIQNLNKTQIQENNHSSNVENKNDSNGNNGSANDGLLFSTSDFVHPAINMSAGLETEGIIARLTHEIGGNVHEFGVVTLSGNYFNEENHQKLGGIVTHNWNGHYESSNQKDSWIQFFFYHKKVTINKYSIMTWNGTTGHMVMWKLEGSNDGKEWTLIDTKNNVTQLCSPNSKCVFRCKYVDSFNTIRITQTGNNSGGDDVLNVTNIEFYGTIY
ncbi:hypothetical protein TRFO_09907 [Tritrichomonas foetus]|uniref:Protein kinase domain-containing protein n=1 Tax=Tritrichomonas foetus TaxID=1144522 RepID=A0A1J4JCW2_9EUKA|nr:hypothetical protein TRFO_09907 [Tritrichomonas foetus]|eukprot:OHS96521.1 hypothetical protein TRFO_09907 [Tritrichomonas foetus]